MDCGLAWCVVSEATLAATNDLLCERGRYLGGSKMILLERVEGRNHHLLI